MLDSQRLFNELLEQGIHFFTGVPDSLLKDFCAYITDHTTDGEHIIAANEGNAVALAAGHYLATRQPGLVYMQNSGIGNAVNPLVSLVDPEVYSIPLLLLIGWRGEPGVKDEPQHKKQGKITVALLETLGIDYSILPEEIEQARSLLQQAVATMKRESRPYAFVVREGTFQPYKLRKHVETAYPMSREDAIKIFAHWNQPEDVVVSTTGKASRELFECRVRMGSAQLNQDFLTVGSMGHAAQIALAIALAQPARQVFCLDGDGALIMHMGSLAIAGSQQAANFKHIVINNGAHDSVGGQPTAGFNIDIPAIARANGYTHARCVETSEDLRKELDLLRESKGPALLEIRVNKGARSDLGRPTTTPLQNKEKFLQFLEK